MSKVTQISASAILALNLAFIQSQGAQAAEFSFSFEIPNSPYSFYNISPGGGNLSFESSPLTGVGEETIRLSQLKNYAGSQTEFNFSFSIYSPFVFPGQSFPDIVFIAPNANNDPVFKFNSGNLIGIFAESSTSNVPASNATMNLFLNENSYSTNYDYTEVVVEEVNVPVYGDIPIYDDQGNVIGFETSIVGYQTEYQYRETLYTDISYVNGNISFTTIEPIPTAVPEPLTMLGVGTALGFGSFFKRELKKKQKSELS